jgi:steroid 5-alpha reductase family enzyme
VSASSARARGFLWIAAAYVAALAVAWAVMARLGPATDPRLTVAYADLAATAVVFVFSAAANNSSVYDPYWSVAPLVIAPWLSLGGGAGAAPVARRVVVTALVVFWGVRLTYNWARGFAGLGHEDWRYVDIRAKVGAGYWPVSLLALHLFPTVQVYLGCLPLFPALTSDRPLGLLDGLAAAVTLGAVLVETVADEQLRSFRARREGDEIMARGLWAFSRHPNYFGEIGFWWGLLLFGLAADPRAFWSGLGALSITAMFVFVSVPMLEKRSVARRPAYVEHRRRVSMLVPWWPKR